MPQLFWSSPRRTLVPQYPPPGHGITLSLKGNKPFPPGVPPASVVNSRGVPYCLCTVHMDCRRPPEGLPKACGSLEEAHGSLSDVHVT